MLKNASLCNTFYHIKYFNVFQWSFSIQFSKNLILDIIQLSVFYPAAEAGNTSVVNPGWKKIPGIFYQWNNAHAAERNSHNSCFFFISFYRDCTRLVRALLVESAAESVERCHPHLRQLTVSWWVGPCRMIQVIWMASGKPTGSTGGHTWGPHLHCCTIRMPAVTHVWNISLD